jgi:hypothetical protein
MGEDISYKGFPNNKLFKIFEKRSPQTPLLRGA